MPPHTPRDSEVLKEDMLVRKEEKGGKGHTGLSGKDVIGKDCTNLTETMDS